MKTLLLLRHAKSSWDDPTLRDHDRPLAPRGEQAAPRMGGFLRRNALNPQLVLCSTALRARQTWELVAPYVDPDPEVELCRDIYDADAPDLLATLRELPAGIDRVLLVGHNPALEDLAESLCGSGDAEARAALHEKFPTAALCEIAFDSDSKDWADIGKGRGRLVRFVKPKALAA